MVWRGISCGGRLSRISTLIRRDAACRFPEADDCCGFPKPGRLALSTPPHSKPGN